MTPMRKYISQSGNTFCEIKNVRVQILQPYRKISALIILVHADPLHYTQRCRSQTKDGRCELPDRILHAHKHTHKSYATHNISFTLSSHFNVSFLVDACNVYCWKLATLCATSLPNPDMSDGKIYLCIGFILALTDFHQIKEKFIFTVSWHNSTATMKRKKSPTMTSCVTRGATLHALNANTFSIWFIIIYICEIKTSYKCNKQSKRTKRRVFCMPTTTEKTILLLLLVVVVVVVVEATAAAACICV